MTSDRPQGRPGQGSAKKPGKPGARGKKRGRRPSAMRTVWTVFKIVLIVIVLVGIGAGVWAGRFVYDAYRTLPPFEAIEWDLTSVIYDTRGRELYRLHALENRTLVPLRRIPVDVQHAVLAIEDHRFREHFGLDIVRFFGAVRNSLLWYAGLGGRLEGGSTLTQQLAKNAFLTHEQTLMRKAQEALIAIELERSFSKDEILEKYLNTVYFGEGAHGIQAAAQVFFGKDAWDLSLAEGAMLAGILQSPGDYDPFVHPESAARRQAMVLNAMVTHGFVDAATAQAAKEATLELARDVRSARVRADFTGAHFVDYVLNLLLREGPAHLHRADLPVFTARDLNAGGFRIYTTLDLDLQRIAEAAVAEVMGEADEKYADAIPEEEGVIQAALVSLNPNTGQILAMVGGRSHEYMRELNRATDTLRQPGSSIKPLVVYAPAIELLGMSPGTSIDDAPVMTIRDDTGRQILWPENYDFRYQGLLPMRYALAQSMNTTAVRTMQRIGPEAGLQYGRRLGLLTLIEPPNQPNDQNLSLALGGLSYGTTVLDMTSSFGVFATMGMRAEPFAITRIEDRTGQVIYEAMPTRQRVLEETTAWVMNDVLKDVIYSNYGTGRRARLPDGRPAAGKTGTTEENVDGWFIGYTPDMVTGVWNGFDNRLQRYSLPYTGAFEPVMVWERYMREAVTELPPRDWERPTGLVQVQICRKSGMLPSPLCPPEDIYAEWFVRGHQPTQVDTVWTTALVCREDPAQLWQIGCGCTPEERLFIRRPEPYETFGNKKPADAHLELPTEFCTAPELPLPPQPGAEDPAEDAASDPDAAVPPDGGEDGAQSSGGPPAWIGGGDD